MRNGLTGLTIAMALAAGAIAAPASAEGRHGWHDHDRGGWNHHGGWRGHDRRSDRRWHHDRRWGDRGGYYHGYHHRHHRDHHGR